MNKILIIDDEEGVRNELRDRIETMGHEVEEAAHVEQALQMIEEMAFDCILLDLGIPKKFEGPTNVHHGRNLLQRIVSETAAPPVIVITAHGLNNYQMATDMFEIGAANFIGKPFDKEPVEEKIRKALGKASKLASADSVKPPFKGGNLVSHDDRIELCGVEVGGTKGNSLIRRILPQLARKNKLGHYIKASRGELATAVNVDTTDSAIANAIKDFREKCELKLGCKKHDVIITHRSGGYQLADWITYQIGSEEHVDTQAESDKSAVLKELKRFKERTRRQISDRTGIPQPRIKSALSKLDDEGKVTLTGIGANAVYKIKGDV